MKQNENNTKVGSKPKKHNKDNEKSKTEVKEKTTNNTTTNKRRSTSTLPNPHKLNIYQRLFNAQQTAGAVLKTGENTHHKYKYAKELDIIAEAKPILGEQRLTYFFKTTKIEKEGKTRQLTNVFTLVNIDKPTETIDYDIESEGENKEGSIVGIPVAYTMALKYFLAKALMLETGNDAEIQELETKKKGKNNSNADKEKPNPNEEYQKHLNLIKTTRNIDGLIEFSEKVKNGKFYNEEQKATLLQAINARVDELNNA